jgi:hypothetical protein
VSDTPKTAQQINLPQCGSIEPVKFEPEMVEREFKFVTKRLLLIMPDQREEILKLVVLMGMIMGEIDALKRDVQAMRERINSLQGSSQHKI